jgi:hypothetical protein
MICARETAYFIARSRIAESKGMRVDYYHAERIPSGWQACGDVNALSHCRAGGVQLYLVHRHELLWSEENREV